MGNGARLGAHGCVNDDGELKLVSDTTPIGELKMYVARPFGVFPSGQAPFLLMLLKEIL